jgi:hypothetical protein
VHEPLPELDHRFEDHHRRLDDHTEQLIELNTFRRVTEVELATMRANQTAIRSTTERIEREIEDEKRRNEKRWDAQVSWRTAQLAALALTLLGVLAELALHH